MKKPEAIYYSVLKYEPENLELMRENFEVTEIENPDCDTEELLSRVEVLFAPLGYDFGKRKIDSCPKLKVIASNTTGAPHIDLGYAREKGIFVAYLGPETEFLDSITPTAEHTWGLLMSITRKVPWAFDAVKRGEWNRFEWGAPKMLSRMSLGIIGLGRLGKKVASYGLAFGMDTAFYDPYVDKAHVSGVKKYATLEELVSTSDIVTIHAHLNSETEGMINAELFSKFKKGAYLINTARGAIVDQEAMLHALESGQLAGAGVDVLADQFEKDYSSGVLSDPVVIYAQKHQNLIITPHIAGSTCDAWFLTRRHTIEMAVKYFK